MQDIDEIVKKLVESFEDLDTAVDASTSALKAQNTQGGGGLLGGAGGALAAVGGGIAQKTIGFAGNAAINAGSRLVRQTISNGIGQFVNNRGELNGTNTFASAFNQAGRNLPFLGNVFARHLDPIDRAANRTLSLLAPAVRRGALQGHGEMQNAVRENMKRFLPQEKRFQQLKSAVKKEFNKQAGSGQVTQAIDSDVKQLTGKLVESFDKLDARIQALITALSPQARMALEHYRPPVGGK